MPTSRLPFTAIEMISISTTQTFCSWIETFHLRRPMAFLSLSLYDTPGRALRMNVLFWGPCEFSVSYSTGIPRGALEIFIQEDLWSIRNLIQQFEVSLSRMLNGILALGQLQWLPNRSDFPPIAWPWYWAWPSPNNEWFPWSIYNGCGMPAGDDYPSGHLVPSPF